MEYLRKNRPGLFTRLLLSGKLMEHLYEIDDTCHDRMELMVSQMKQAEGITEALKASDQRIAELDVTIRKLYESFAKGITPEKRFEMLSASFEQEQQALRDLVEREESELSENGIGTENIGAFISLAKKYRNADEITPAMINAFIDRIEVSAPKKVNGERTVQIEIHFRFIGQFSISQIPTEMTAEELEEEQRRAKQREKNHASYLHRKEKRIAAMSMPA